MVNKLVLVTLYLSAFALARPSNIRRQEDGPTLEVPEEGGEVPEEPVEEPGKS